VRDKEDKSMWSGGEDTIQASCPRMDEAAVADVVAAAESSTALGKGMRKGREEREKQWDRRKEK